MTDNIVRVEAGALICEAIGIFPENADRWQAYDFFTGEWVRVEKSASFWPEPFPYPNGLTFMQMVLDHTQHLPAVAVVWVHGSNETFGAFRPVTTDRPAAPPCSSDSGR